MVIILMGEDNLRTAIMLLRQGMSSDEVEKNLKIDKRVVDKAMREARRALVEEFSKRQWEADIMEEWNRLERLRTEYHSLLIKVREAEKVSLEKQVLDSLTNLTLKKMEFLQKIGVLAPDVMFSMNIYNTKVGTVNLAKIDYSLQRARELEESLNLGEIVRR